MAKRYTLTKPQRAAAVLVAMGKSRASQLLKFFKSEELRIMIDAAHTLKTIPQPDLEELVKEFEAEFTVGAGLMDSAEAMQKILGEALSEEEMYAITGMGHDPGALEPGTEYLGEAAEDRQGRADRVLRQRIAAALRGDPLTARFQDRGNDHRKA